MLQKPILGSVADCPGRGACRYTAGIASTAGVNVSAVTITSQQAGSIVLGTLIGFPADSFTLSGFAASLQAHLMASPMAAFTSDSSFASDYGPVSFSRFNLVGRNDALHPIKSADAGDNDQARPSVLHVTMSRSLMAVGSGGAYAEPPESVNALGIVYASSAPAPGLVQDSSTLPPGLLHDSSAPAPGPMLVSNAPLSGLMLDSNAPASHKQSTMTGSSNSTSGAGLLQQNAANSSSNSSSTISAVDQDDGEAHAEYGTFIPVGGYEPPPPVSLPPPPPGSSASSSTASPPPPPASSSSAASPPPPPTSSSSVGA